MEVPVRLQLLNSPASVPTSPPNVRKRLPPQPPIPPVSELLSLFPPLFALPQAHPLDSLRPLPFSQRQRILAHPQTKRFLEGVREIGRVAGRIIAGRKRRVRKQALPKGHRARGSQGSSEWELQEEEREAKETVRIWQEGAGRRRAAMGAGASGVPEISEDVIRGPGLEEAACRVCLLEREKPVKGLRERNEKAGWWHEAWGGHKGCRGFFD